MLLVRSLVAAFSLIGATAATATPVFWTITGTFRDDTTFSGSFTYDADTDQYSGVDIVTTAGPEVPGSHYLVADNASSFPNYLQAYPALAGDLTGTPLLALVFNSVLTNAGGSVLISSTGEGECGNTNCTDFAGEPFRQVFMGEAVSGTPVPEPASFALSALGLAALTLIRFRRAS